MARPREPVLDCCHGASRRTHLAHTSYANHRHRAGECEIDNGDDEEAPAEAEPERVDAERGRHGEEQRTEVRHEATAAEKAGADAGALDVGGELCLRELDLAVDKDGEIAADRRDQLAETLVIDGPATWTDGLRHDNSLPGVGAG